jgi:tetratricopeptide (TPR) repeat protein
LGNYQKADEDLKNSLKINPDDAYVLNYLAYSWLERDYKIEEAKAAANQLEYISSTLLLSQSKSWIEDKNFKVFNKIFSCSNHNDITSEFLFLISNLFSSQGDIEKSNFYLNLSNYLNRKFILNSSLVAENFYLNGEYDKAKKILSIFDKKYLIFFLPCHILHLSKNFQQQVMSLK